MLKVGFLLGAGASFPFGIPMMREFYERFISYIDLNRSHCMPLVRKIAEGAAQHDLESFIQQLEQVRAVRQGLKVLGETEGEIYQRLELADDLRGYLDMFLIETCEKFNDEKVTTVLSKFVQFAGNRNSDIFTTNYDRLVEVAATSSGVVYSDGFETGSSRPESAWNGIFAPGIRLIKLHGSVNWYEEGESERLVRLERGYSLPSREYRLTHGERALRPLMIIPTLEKAILRQPYAGLLTQFSDALKELDIFVVIGNSLRDDHLRNTVIERASGLQIVLINPAARDQINIVGQPERTHSIPLGIEEFIDTGLEPFGRLLDQISGHSTDEFAGMLSEFAAQLTALADESHGMSKEQREQFSALNSGSIEAKLSVLRSANSASHSALVNAIRELARVAPDDSIRVAAIDAFVEARGADAAEVLGEIVRGPGTMVVRAEAALALKSLDSGAAADILARTSDAISEDLAIRALLS